MKLPFIIFYCILFCTCSLTASAQTFKWVNTIHYTNYTSVGPLTKIDHHDNIIAIGNYGDTLNIGSHQYYGLTNSLYDLNGYLIKYDRNGNLKWALNIPLTDTFKVFSPSAIAIDKEDNIYITGNANSSTIFFSPTDSVNYRSQMGCFIAKYDSSGNFMWAIPVDGSTKSRALTTDANGNIIWSGIYYEDSVRLAGITLPSSGAYLNFVIAKFAPNGTLIWERSGSSTSGITVDGAITDLATDDSDNIYATGFVQSNMIFGTDEIVDTSANIRSFIMKFDSNNTIRWVKTEYIGANQDCSKSITLDGKGNLYFTGTYLSSRRISSFVCKYAVDGTKKWLKQYNDSFYSSTINIVTDAAGNPYVYGDFDYMVDLGIGLITSPYNTVFIAKLDTTGLTLGAQIVKGYSKLGSLAVNDDGNNAIITGIFSRKDVFGNIIADSPYPNNSFFAYLSIPSLSVPSIPDLSHTTIYPNPAANVLYVKDATPNTIFSIYNVNGQQVYTGTITGTQQPVSLAAFTNGIYFIRMITPNGIIQTKTFVKE